jgi:hypothetical protein
MPNLATLTVCERVIVDAKGIPSLINIFQKMHIMISETPGAQDAAIGIRWSVFTIWQTTSDEIGKEFTQHTEITAPDGKQFSYSQAKFRRSPIQDPNLNINVEVLSMPIWAEGLVNVAVWIDGGEKHHYPFEIKYAGQENIIPQLSQTQPIH